MLHEIGTEVAAYLVAQGCPFRVVDGPEPTTTTTFARERVVFEYDGNDSFGHVRSQRPNPNVRLLRQCAAKLTIYAQCPSSAATTWEHRNRAEHVLDLVLVALDKALHVRRNGYQIKSGRFIVPVDLQGSPVIGGAAYELAFEFERAIETQTFAGAFLPESTVGTGVTIRNTATAVGPDGTTETIP